MRLIDADKLLEYIEEEIRTVKARTRGKWIKENIVLTSYPPQYQWHCSECGTTMQGYSAVILTDFCSNCGADMRGDDAPTIDAVEVVR